MPSLQYLVSFERSLSAFVVFLALLSGHQDAFATNDKPNIVVIMTDDAGYNGFGFQAALSGGTFKGLTPNIDSLAQQGVVARQAYATTLCSISRVALLTGQYPNRYGIEDNLGSSIRRDSPDRRLGDSPSSRPPLHNDSRAWVIQQA